MIPLKEQLEAIRSRAAAELEQASDPQALETLRVKYLGKKGELTAILKQMGGLSAEERPVIGQLANEVRAFLEDVISRRAASLKAGGAGVRYRCRIQHQERYLYLEEDQRWFVEQEEPGRPSRP